MSFFLSASYSGRGSFFQIKLSSRFILDNLSFAAKSCCLIFHIVWNSFRVFASPTFFLPLAFAAFTLGGRLFSVSWELSESALSSHFLFFELPSFLAVARSHHFWSFRSSFQACSNVFLLYGYCRKIDELVSEYHYHFDRYFSLWLQLHRLHKTCTQDHWSCAIVACND